MLNDRLQRDVDLLDEILHLAVFRRLHDGSGYRVLITGVCVDHIPFCVLCHPAYTNVISASTAALARESKPQSTTSGGGHNDQRDQRVLAELLGGGPDDLFELALHLAEPLGDALEEAELLRPSA